MTGTIQVQVAAPACDRCPVAALSERTTLREVRADPDDARVDFVADLGVAKSTVSEHLRLVAATVLSQLFGERF